MDYMEAKGWLTPEERMMLAELASLVADCHPEAEPVILNIGVEYGASLHCLYQGSPSALIVGVDIDISKAEVDGLPVVLIEADSTEYAKAWDRGIDLLLVDGDHSYEGVKADLAWLKWIPVSGIVVFHDCYDWPPSPPETPHGVCPGVNIAVQEWFGDSKDIPGPRWQENIPLDTMRIFTRME